MIRAPAACAALLALSSCAPSHVAGRWIGPVTPAKPSETCKPTRGMAQIERDQVIFAPDEGTWILHGTVDAGGDITAERLTTGANRQPYETRLVAKRTPDLVTGTYTTPRCTFSVSLNRR